MILEIIKKIDNFIKVRSRLLGAVLLFSVAIFLLFAVRGYSGTPTAKELSSPKWQENGPFELSPERGRYALLYSIVEDKSLQFSEVLKDFPSPDVAINGKGEYVSLFAPGLSIILLPGYVVGKLLGGGQIGASLMIVLFAILNFILIKVIAVKLGSKSLAAYLGAIIFLFATPAFAYSASIYQHHITTFLILFSIYLILKWDNVWVNMTLFFICSISIIIDNPNLFLFFPIGLIALKRALNINFSKQKLNINFRFLSLLSFLIVLIPLSLFALYNQKANLDPLTLSGTLNSSKDIVIREKQVKPTEDVKKDDKQALNFFKTRNLLNGFYTFTVSPDRGILFFTPIILFGIWGFIFLYKKNPGIANLFLGIIGINFLLYSMWGDPYGGWAFGSRYLIPSYALLAICVSFVLPKIKSKYFLAFLFVIIFSYSIWVNTLGAITSSANPPKIEVLGLEERTGQIEKYTYERNLDFLNNNGSKSFMYNLWVYKIFSAQTYLKILSGTIIFMGLILFILIPKEKRNNLI